MFTKNDILLDSVKDFFGGGAVFEDGRGRLVMDLGRPAVCGCCGTDCGFVRNGFLDREAYSLCGIHELRNQRYLCKALRDRRHTFSALPPFCAKAAPMGWIFSPR